MKEGRCQSPGHGVILRLDQLDALAKKTMGERHYSRSPPHASNFECQSLHKLAGETSAVNEDNICLPPPRKAVTRKEIVLFYRYKAVMVQQFGRAGLAFFIRYDRLLRKVVENWENLNSVRSVQDIAKEKARTDYRPRGP